MRACQIQQHFYTSSHNFAIQPQTTVGSLASAHIVLQLSDSTALNSGTRLKLIIFSDGASPVPVLSYLFWPKREICLKNWNDRTCAELLISFSYVSGVLTYEALDVFSKIICVQSKSPEGSDGSVWFAFTGRASNNMFWSVVRSKWKLNFSNISYLLFL